MNNIFMFLSVFICVHLWKIFFHSPLFLAFDQPKADNLYLTLKALVSDQVRDINMLFFPAKRAFVALTTVVFALLLVTAPCANSQSKPQKPTDIPGDGKKNGRPAPQTEEERLKAEAAKKQAEEEKTRSSIQRSKRSRPASSMLTRSFITKKQGR